MGRFGPIDVDSNNWLYVELDGLELIHETYRSGLYVQTDHVLIPWETVRRSLAVHDKRKAPRKQAVAKDGTAQGRKKQPVGRRAETQKR